MKIIGHQTQWQFLIKSAQAGKLPHAFLFSGQEGLGKKVLAIEFIKWLFCQNRGEGNACQVCKSCQDVQKGQHPDLFLIAPEEKEIKIAQTRELKWKLSLTSSVGIFKIAIIDRAHLMNQEAQNSILKTLEEPKGKALLILISEFPETLFPTILSRVQKIKFFPVPQSEIENYLLSQGASPNKAKEIARLSLGRPGKALNFLNSEKFAFHQKAILDFEKLANSPLARRFEYVKELADDFQKLKEVLEYWQNYLRSILFQKICEKKIKESSFSFDKYSVSKLKNIIQSLQTTDRLISTTNISQRLALETLMLEL